MEESSCTPKLLSVLGAQSALFCSTSSFSLSDLIIFLNGIHGPEALAFLAGLVVSVTTVNENPSNKGNSIPLAMLVLNDDDDVFECGRTPTNQAF